jgi:hypothetical protein
VKRIPETLKILRIKLGRRSHNVVLNVSGPSSFDILQGHSKATMLLIANNAAQGILSSFFFKYAG